MSIHTPLFMPDCLIAMFLHACARCLCCHFFAGFLLSLVYCHADAAFAGFITVTPLYADVVSPPTPFSMLIAATRLFEIRHLADAWLPAPRRCLQLLSPRDDAVFRFRLTMLSRHRRTRRLFCAVLYCLRSLRCHIMMAPRIVAILR